MSSLKITVCHLLIFPSPVSQNSDFKFFLRHCASLGAEEREHLVIHHSCSFFLPEILDFISALAQFLSSKGFIRTYFQTVVLGVRKRSDEKQEQIQVQIRVSGVV